MPRPVSAGTTAVAAADPAADSERSLPAVDAAADRTHARDTMRQPCIGFAPPPAVASFPPDRMRV
jgi:hypothetical protein